MKLNAHSTLLPSPPPPPPPPSLSVGLGEFYSTLLTLCATLMIIKHFVVVTKSHWHILWADVALLLPLLPLLPLLLFKLCPILPSSDQIKYISTWLGNVNIDLFARNLVRCVFVVGGRGGGWWYNADVGTGTHYFDSFDASNRTLIYFVRRTRPATAFRCV